MSAGWLLDWIPSNEGLAEPLVDVEFPKQYPACISTYRHGMGFHHRLLVCQCLATAGPVAGSTDFFFLATTTLALAGGTAAYSGRFEPTGCPCVEHPVSPLLSS